MCKIYLCDGCACGKDLPSICYLLGGECCHTNDERFSASKVFSKTFPKTKWVRVDGIWEKEIFDTAETLKALIG